MKLLRYLISITAYSSAVLISAQIDQVGYSFNQGPGNLPADRVVVDHFQKLDGNFVGPLSDLSFVEGFSGEPNDHGFLPQNGVRAYFAVREVYGLSSFWSDFTIEINFQFNEEISNFGNLITFDEEGSGHAKVIRDAGNNRLRIMLGDTNIFTSILEENKWYHLAITFAANPNEVRVYLDGHLQGQTSSANRLLKNDPDRIAIGGNFQASGTWIAPVDDFRFTNRILGQDEFLLSGFGESEPIEVEIFKRYVAPQALGTGSGLSAENAAFYEGDTSGFNSSQFWNQVQDLLDRAPVKVTFLDGQYVSHPLILRLRGNSANRLTLQSETRGGATFNDSARISLLGCRNLTLKDFAFTGSPSDPEHWIAKLTIHSHDLTRDGIPSRDILIVGNNFHDTPTYYGAVVVSSGSHHITIYDNIFDTVGRDSSAHMIYNAYGVHHIKIIGNTFLDCPGDYVRFRDNADFGEVRLNTFISSNALYNRPFVHMPVFNTSSERGEIHASNYLIRDNTFSYLDADSAPDHYRNIIGFYSSGWDPLDLQYLPTAEEGWILENGLPEEKRQLLLDNMDIDLERMHVYANQIKGHNHLLHYGAAANYGAVSNGWVGFANISDALVNTSIPVYGDLDGDGSLTENDVAMFIIALDSHSEKEFLLDDRVWFADYLAADLNGDGRVDVEDIPDFIRHFKGHVDDEILKPLAKRVPLHVEALPLPEEKNFRMLVRGSPFQDIMIEASEDLINWTDMEALQLDVEGEREYVDSGVDSNPRRFYRVRYP